ncbi:MAG: hypothetical protein MJK12_11075 [Colwellia sp.]|nr:hypothetical protein [Colwellia sp.]
MSNRVYQVLKSRNDNKGTSPMDFSLLKNGNNPRKYSNIATTMRYVHLEKNQVAEKMKALRES